MKNPPEHEELQTSTDESLDCNARTDVRSVSGYVRGDAMRRQIMEAVEIIQIPNEKKMNDKSEWNVGKLPVNK